MWEINSYSLKKSSPIPRIRFQILIFFRERYMRVRQTEHSSAFLADKKRGVGRTATYDKSAICILSKGDLVE